MAQFMAKGQTDFIKDILTNKGKKKPLFQTKNIFISPAFCMELYFVAKAIKHFIYVFDPM